MKNKIINDFKELFAAAAGILDVPGSVMAGARQECFRCFIEAGGVPDGTEAYRYLKLLPLFSADYNVMLERVLPETKIEDLFKCAVHGMVSYPVVTVNGWFHPDNDTSGIPEGVICCSMQEAEVKYRDILQKHYNKYTVQADGDPLVSLNGAFAQDGVFLYVPSDVRIEAPVQIINLLQSAKPLMAYQRNLIVVESGAKLSILVCDHTLSDTSILMNNVTEMSVGENAHVDLIQIQSQKEKTSQFNSLCTDQKEYSDSRTIVLSLYGNLIRNNLFTRLGGIGANADLFGCYILGGRQCVDNFTYIDHAMPSCTSNELFKGVMDGRSVGNFIGCIQVRPDAQKTEAYQANNNLLLTNQARINTKPRLIIDADDVKCSHGATVGQIDEEAMFYLRSRGIGIEEARMMMMAGFAHDIIRRIDMEPLRNKVAMMVENRLRGNVHTCDNCKITCNQKDDRC